MSKPEPELPNLASSDGYDAPPPAYSTTFAPPAAIIQKQQQQQQQQQWPTKGENAPTSATYCGFVTIPARYRRGRYVLVGGAVLLVLILVSSSCRLNDGSSSVAAGRINKPGFQFAGLSMLQRDAGLEVRYVSGEAIGLAMRGLVFYNPDGTLRSRLVKKEKHGFDWLFSPNSYEHVFTGEHRSRWTFDEPYVRQTHGPLGRGNLAVIYYDGSERVRIDTDLIRRKMTLTLNNGGGFWSFKRRSIIELTRDSSSAWTATSEEHLASMKELENEDAIQVLAMVIEEYFADLEWSDSSPVFPSRASVTSWGVEDRVSGGRIACIQNNHHNQVLVLKTKVAGNVIATLYTAGELEYSSAAAHRMSHHFEYMDHSIYFNDDAGPLKISIGTAAGDDLTSFEIFKADGKTLLAHTKVAKAHGRTPVRSVMFLDANGNVVGSMSRNKHTGEWDYVEITNILNFPAPLLYLLARFTSNHPSTHDFLLK